MTSPKSLTEILHPYAARKMMEVRGKKRFVHYTSATAAMSIIQGKQVWMRNVTRMNDFTEVRHGLDLLFGAYRSDRGKELRAALDTWFPDLCKEVEDLFNGWDFEMRSGTFISCFSEHESEEDSLGRLSMWRGYGSSVGVALVLNSEPFFSESNALNVFSTPVAYLSQGTFQSEFDRLAEGIIANEEVLKALDREAIKNSLFFMYVFMALATKHQGFAEEKEWRVVHLPKIYPSTRLAKAVKLVSTSPEVVYQIPLANIPGEGLTGIEMPELLHHLIIGPSDHAVATFDAFMELLESAGITDAGARISISDIPLR